MNKKKYQKPEMKIYPMHEQKPLLGASQTPSYIPRMDQDMNQKA